jgi:hypothetical protein
MVEIRKRLNIDVVKDLKVGDKKYMRLIII